MKTVKFNPVNTAVSIHTQESLLQALLANECDVLMACGGKGMCATCHVFIAEGMDQLSPRNSREERTLGFITGVKDNSRLACQCQVLGEGVVVQLPEGMYIERAEDLMSLLGQRAESDVLHPIDGSILIKKGKIITKGRINDLRDLNVKVSELKAD